jgi:hypothetical protein
MIVYLTAQSQISQVKFNVLIWILGANLFLFHQNLSTVRLKAHLERDKGWCKHSSLGLFSRLRQPKAANSLTLSKPFYMPPAPCIMRFRKFNIEVLIV